MSQMLTRPKIRQGGLIQDIYLTAPKITPTTGASPVSCHVCDRCTSEGLSISAKIIGGETVLLCELHH